MRLVLLLCATIVMGGGEFGITSQVTTSKDSSILKPADSSYVEAMEFAQFLNGQGIKVNSVHASKLNGFFRTLEKAAFLRTEKGVVEVVFFPEPLGAEKVKLTEHREKGRYVYTFEGQPSPEPGDGIDASRPMYFLMHGKWFIVTETEDLYNALKGALQEG